MNPSKLVCVLLVEADPADAQLLQIGLRQFKETPLEVTRVGADTGQPQKTVDSRLKNMHFEVSWVQTLEAALHKLGSAHFDVVLLDLALPDGQGFAAIRTLKQKSETLPIIVLLPPNAVDAAETAISTGANGYIVKNDAGYVDLVRVLRYVLHRADVKTRNQLLVAGLEATSNAIIITDKEARIEWANPAFAELTGYSFQETLGRTPTELLKSGVHDAAFYQQMWQHLLERGHWQGEIVNRHKSGGLYNADVGISAVYNKDGSLSGYVQMQRDITDSVVRLAISEVLRQSTPLEQRFRELLDILFNLKSFDLQRKGGVFVRSKDDDYLSMLVLSGDFSPEFIAKEQRVACGSCLCGRVALSGKLLVSDDCFCDPLHEHQFEDMQAHGHYIVPIAADADILGVLFLYTDPYPVRTESRLAMLTQVGEMMALALRQDEAKKALEAARDMAMQASLLKSAFLANMSHEIRTPMNGVLGMLDLLRETQLTSTQRDWIQTAHNSAEALLDVINDILDFSKLEAGKFEVEQVDFDLVNLVDDICALLATRAHANGLELSCFLPVPMPARWRGDPMRIRQVLTNLIGNAVKFTEHGEISVRVTRLDSQEGAEQFHFAVSDTGIGISDSVKGALFQPFSQADSATSRRFGGSGLGLSISKKLVELMGGTLGVDSELGKGSCFWFTLPLLPSTAQETPGHAYDVSGKRVLVVDDNATNRSILQYYLSSWGLAVEAVDNGAAALMALQAQAILGERHDLVVLDVQMPGMDGLGVAQNLAGMAGLAQTPIILLSSGDLFELNDYLGTGVVQRLLKPVRQSQLFDAIVTALLGVLDSTIRPQPAAAEWPSYAGKKVLVVEDNAINQKVIVAKLSKFDIVPDLAEHGQIALDKATCHHYDLIFMDCQMPVLDGYAATRELRVQEQARALPRQTVVALTATALDGEREKCLAAGMDAYLSKPIINEQLIGLLAYYLGSSGLAEAQPETSLASSFAPVWDAVATLKHLEGDHELLHELMGLFLTEAQQQLEDLSQHLAQGNVAAIANTAHALKGTTAHFYALSASDAANSLEVAARKGDAAVLADLSAELNAKVMALIAQLQAELSHSARSLVARS